MKTRHEKVYFMGWSPTEMARIQSTNPARAARIRASHRAMTTGQVPHQAARYLQQAMNLEYGSTNDKHWSLIGFALGHFRASVINQGAAAKAQAECNQLRREGWEPTLAKPIAQWGIGGELRAN